MFEVLDFEQLHKFKIKDIVTSDRICANYFFCLNQKMLYIKKARKNYVICASCQCMFECKYHESVMDVVYISNDLEEVISQFKFLVSLLIKRSF